MDDSPAHHLDPKAEMHPTVLAPGDPARAMAIATAHLTEPRMFNHRRGLWGYSGHTADGLGVVVQSTGMGGPSAAIVFEELIELGARKIVRVGTCAAIDPAVQAGDLVVAGAAIGDDGASRELLRGENPATRDTDHRLSADRTVTGALLASANRLRGERAVHQGTIASVDLFYDPQAGERYERLRGSGAIAIEMEAATLFAVAARHGVEVGCVLGVSDELWRERNRLGHEEIVELGDMIGAIAIAAVDR